MRKYVLPGEWNGLTKEEKKGFYCFNANPPSEDHKLVKEWNKIMPVPASNLNVTLFAKCKKDLEEDGWQNITGGPEDIKKRAEENRAWFERRKKDIEAIIEEENKNQ